MHTTNYSNTLITLAEDCPNNTGLEPPTRGNKKSIANHQYERLTTQPYHYTSDELLFAIHALRKEIPDAQLATEEAAFFGKPQACLRTSPLAKRYGWGIHANSEGRLALVSADDERYQTLLNDKTVNKVKAMRSSRK